MTEVVLGISQKGLLVLNLGIILVTDLLLHYLEIWTMDAEPLVLLYKRIATSIPVRMFL